MKNTKIILLLLLAFSVGLANLSAQVNEPEFIGEAFLLNNDSSTLLLDKEIAQYTAGVSWSANSWNALSIEIPGGRANSRLLSNTKVKIVVRAMDNNSDPLTIISIYRFKARPNKRTVVVSEDNSGTLMKSRTNTEDLVRFNGKKFGKTSYIIEISNLYPGEYGIIVANPNNVDEKRTVVSCFGVD